MARKSRKNLPVVMAETEQSLTMGTVMKTAGELNCEVKSYHAAIYARLSYETEANWERDTVETQIAYLRNFIDRQEDMELADVYADVSFSGTNFERPEFERMMQDIRTGEIDTVITKDLSRLGRNYIDSGTYIEQIFPLFHVRYIAVNDDFDTNREGTDLAMPLKNIINEWYARDISGKIRSSYRAMWKNGQYAYGRPPYGYKKDSMAKKLIADEQTAPVVKRIFGMYLSGFLPDKDWVAVVKKFMGKRKLTKEMANAFVERIVLDKEGNVEIALKYDDFLKELIQTAGEGCEND